MKILLFNPPFMRFLQREQDYPHIGLAYLGTFLEQLGHEVVIRNLEVALNDSAGYIGYHGLMDAHQLYLDGLQNDQYPIWGDVGDAIYKVQPDLVGVTARTVQVPSALKVAEIVKRYGDIPVAVGGIHATARPQDFDSPYIDEVVQGEGENSNWSILPQSRLRLVDMDDYPIPNRDLFMEEYGLEGLGHMVTTRGCPFSCTFCGQQVLWGKKVRFRSVDNILEEMVMLDDKYGVKSFRFWDDSFTLKKNRIIELCQRMPDRGWMWHCDTRLDLLSELMLHSMMGAGCNRISLGVESGSPRVLEMTKKGETVEQLRLQSEMLESVGSEYDDFQWRIYVMAGFPTETDEEIQMTWDLAKELEPDRICLSTFTFYPGTEMYDEGLKKGWVDSDRNWAAYSHQVTDRPIIRKFAEWVDEYNAERGGRWV